MSVFTVLCVLCIKELVLFNSYTHAQAHQPIRIVKKCAVTSSIFISQHVPAIWHKQLT